MNTRRLFIAFLLFVISSFQVEAYEEPIPDMTLTIPMRDGQNLPADVYLPAKDAKDLPCILLRSPAGRRKAYWLPYIALAKAGYVVVIQDTRSGIDKEGKTLPYYSDGWGDLQDGYDTIVWLANHPLTNGKIGTAGHSALGITQLLLAPTAPQNLKCQYISMAAASLYHDAIYPGGGLLKNQAEGWLGLYAPDTGVHNLVTTQPFYNRFWQSLNTLEQAQFVSTPAIHYGGWYDTFLQGTINAFKERQEKGREGAKGEQKLVIGPWTHYWPFITKLGDFDVPQTGMLPPFDISLLSWFDYHLKGVQNGTDKIPSVLYYVMGPFDGSPSKGNVWKTASTWPIPYEPFQFYLTVNNELVKQPLSKQGKISYEYDPLVPTPTIGGRNLFIESGAKDQSSIEERKDVVVFTSEPLIEDLEVTGPLKAVIYFTTDQKDTDVVVKLCDVYPDGRSILIADGLCRLAVCYPNQKFDNPFPVEIDLCATSMVFAKDHKIRVSISSSNYPKYERNLNIGVTLENKSKLKVAANTIYLGDKTPSHIVLPIPKE